MQINSIFSKLTNNRRLYNYTHGFEACAYFYYVPRVLLYTTGAIICDYDCLKI